MEHWHVSVSENGFYTDRRECYYGDDVLSRAKEWVSEGIRLDASDYRYPGSEVTRMLGEIEKFDPRSDGIDVTIEAPYGAKTIMHGYRIMSIDGACERTMDMEDA